ncbi:MAG TPA: MMPL family transporter [Solirubrobacteraceae bacterium]
MTTSSLPHPAGAPPSGRLAGFVRAAARRAARRPRLTVGLWLAFIIGCAVSGSLVGMQTLSNAGSGVGESAQADARLARAGLQNPATENVLVRSPSAQRTAVAVASLTAQVRALPSVHSVESPPGTPSLSRGGGRTQLVVVTLRGSPGDAGTNVVPLEHAVAHVAARTPGVGFLEAGDGSGTRAVNRLVAQGLRRAELISVPLSLLILVLAFGAVVAACVPLLLGATSVAAALGGLGLVSQIAPNGSSTAPVVVLIGLAVGVDYSLFYIRRERAERDAGAGADAALDAASATVGRAILVAGATVTIGLAGLLFTGFGVFTSMALGAILVVAIAVVGSLTVLPAVLALLGERVDRGRLWHRRSAGGAESGRTGGMWGRVAGIVTAHPRASLALAAAVLAGLAVPILGIHTGESGESDMPATTPVVVADHAIRAAFPGTSDTAELVVSGRGLGSDASERRLAQIGRIGERLGHGRGAVSLRVARDGATALVSIPVSARSLAAGRRDVDLLRRRLEPVTARWLSGAHAQVTGGDATGLDFTRRLATVTPIVIALVLGLAFLLLVATFGSPLLALSVIGLNVLSVGAAFGVLVAVFQHTWAQSLLGFTSDGLITDWLPLFAFVVLFGLSMDYTVLVLERAREARRAGAGPREAAAEALGSTGSTVTSAAVVMVAVFSVFATLPLLEFKQLGIGLAAAIALDATLVRGIALPAALTLLGDRGLKPGRARDRTSTWDHPAHAAALGAGYE